MWQQVRRGAVVAAVVVGLGLCARAWVSRPPGAAVPPAPDIETAHSPVLQAGATVEYRWHYQHCGDVEVQLHPIATEWVGLGADEFAALDPTAEVEAFGPLRVVVAKPLAAWCPVHAVNRYITITGGYVTVYRGDEPDPRFIVSQTIPASALDPATRRLLEAGIRTQRDSEVQRLLEGIGD